MAQKTVEMILGKLTCDEEFRLSFKRDPAATLAAIRNCGLDLTPWEITAILATDASVFDRLAEGIDPRLQRASLRCEPPSKPAAEPEPDAERDPADERRPS